jgi:hypothetical protein
MRPAARLLLVLAYLVLLAGLAPRALSWDAYGFLLLARAGAIDYGHALYVPLLRGAQALAGPWLDPEQSARAVSLLGAGLALSLLWRRAERSGAGPLAPLAAAPLPTSGLFWHEAGSIEPASWTIAALLLAAEAAAAYARERTQRRLVLLTLATGLALSFHVVSVCALPWLARSALRPARLPPPRQLLLPGVLVALLVLLVVGDGRWPAYRDYWTGFLPDLESGLAHALGQHVRRGASLVLEGAPLLVLLGLVGVPSLWRAGRRAVLVDAGLLAGPYGLAFLALGKPLVGLLLPALLAPALVAIEAAALARARGPAGALVPALGLLGGMLVTFVQAIEWARTPDEDRARAALLARDLPAGARLFSGQLANALLHDHPALDVVSLPDLIHAARARDRTRDPIEIVEAESARSGAPSFLSGDGFVFLQQILGADPYRLGLAEGRTWFVPEDPRLCLIPLGEAGGNLAPPGR